MRAASGVTTCPACGGPLKADAKWCPACDFTGEKSLDMFPGDPPPLLPILDAVGALDDDGIRKIVASRENLRRRFPQFQWRICLVELSKQTSLPLFGFWLLNTCPLDDGESMDDRAWTILLLINAGTGQAAVIPGYAAEPFLSDDEWKSILVTMADSWSAGKPADAIVRFFTASRSRLDEAWALYGARQSNRKPS